MPLATTVLPARSCTPVAVTVYRLAEAARGAASSRCTMLPSPASTVAAVTVAPVRVKLPALTDPALTGSLKYTSKKLSTG